MVIEIWNFFKKKFNFWKRYGRQRDNNKHIFMKILICHVFFYEKQPFSIKNMQGARYSNILFLQH